MKIEPNMLTKRSFLYYVYGLRNINWDSGYSTHATRVNGVWEDKQIVKQSYVYGTQIVKSVNNDGIEIRQTIEYNVPSKDFKEGFLKILEVAKKEYFNQEIYDAYLEAGFKIKE